MQTDLHQRQRTRAAFTLIELLVIIVIIGILAGLTVSVSSIASRRSKMTRTQAELARLDLAIRDYKARFGFYPPDNVVDRNTLAVNPAINQLYYELSGCRFDVTNNTYIALGDAESEGIDRNIYRGLFGGTNIAGVYNSATSAANLKNFLSGGRSLQVRTVRALGLPDFKVLAVPVEWPPNHALAASDPRFRPIFDARPGFPEVSLINPWRYNATNPINNPGEFDLWAEIVIGDEIVTIGNWKEE